MGFARETLFSRFTIEPLLHTIYAYSSILGFSFQEGSDTRLTNPLIQIPIFKSMAYADDIAVFLVDSGEAHALLDILAFYSRASIVHLNSYKTSAVLPLGQPQHSWLPALSSYRLRCAV